MRGFCEEATYFGIGILSGLKAAEEFHDELGAVENGGIGLLGRAGACGQWDYATGFGESAAAVAHENAVASGKFRVRFNEIQDRLPNVFARDRIMQDCGAVGGRNGGDDACWIGSPDRFRSFAGGDGKSELIDDCTLVIENQLKKDQYRVQAGKLCSVEDLHSRDGSRFCAEPALVRQIGCEELLKEQ